MEFPQLDSIYEDEFGEIDPDVYQVGRELWQRQAQGFVESILHDEDESWYLMIRAIANVSKFRREHPSEIEEISPYLFTSFKRLVFAKLKQDGNRRRILDERFQDSEVGEETKMLRTIEVEEILAKFTVVEREIFELHYVLEYTYEEIAPEYGMKANYLRNKMSRAIRRISSELRINA